MSFRDAEILFFPVPTMSGPRRITTPALLEAAGCANVPKVKNIEKVLVQTGDTPLKRINLGWILLDSESQSIPFPAFLKDQPCMAHVRDKLVLVHDDLFPAWLTPIWKPAPRSPLTSRPGAADGLLFTYEAAPRGALYRGQVDFDDQRFPDLYAGSVALVQKGLALACQLGWAMTTRGFGRMQPMLQGV